MRRRAALLAVLLCLLAGGAVAQPAILVLDASGSMWGRVEGRTRIAVARDAIAGLMSRWPATRPVGLIAYGHRRAQDCGDVEILRAPAPDGAAVADLAQRITPRGRTPMAEAVRLAAEALGPGGGSVILVSDGVETCHPDPCAVAQQVARSAPRVAVHTVAFALSDPVALAQLRCMAEVTGGRASTARDATELAAALDRAAAAAAPGPRAAAPRPEPVPQPKLIVAPRLCATCDPMVGDVTIVVRRGEEVVASGSEPFGRFFDLAPGDYAVTVEAGSFSRGPVPVTVPETGPGRIEIVLDAGWLVGDARSEPSGEEVTDRARLAWRAGPGDARSEEGGPAFLVPAGACRLEARLGNARGEAEAQVAAGEVVMLPVPIRFGTLALRCDGFRDGAPRILVTDLDGHALVFDDRPGEERAEIPLAPGRYRVTAGYGTIEAAAEIEIRDEAVEELTLRPGD